MIREYFLKTILLFSFFAMSSAYYIEYILGYQPCNLCILQRIPYIGSIIIITFFFIFKRFEKLILFTILILFFFGFIISFYHFGIENNFFQESFICNLTGDSKITNSSELLKSLKTGPISCKDVPFKLLGMSLASINTVLTLFICVISLRILVNYEKNK